MGATSNKPSNAAEIDRLALEVATDPGSKAFVPLAEEYGKVGMWGEAAGVLEDGLKVYPQFITAMVALGRAYDQMNQPVKAVAVLEEAVKLSPDNLRAHRTLAKIYVAQGEGSKEAALQSCRAILAVNHQDQEALALCAKLQSSAVRDSPAPSDAEVPTVAPSVGTSAGVDGHKEDPADSRPLENGSPVGVNVAGPSRREHAGVAELQRWLNNIEYHRRDRNPSVG